MGIKAYILMADGFETIEALAPIDVLRRCGVEIVSVSIKKDRNVISSHKVPVTTDTTIYNCDTKDGDIVIIPGGYPGYVNLRNSKQVGEILKDYAQKNKFIAAICGGPTLLESNQIALGSKITCHSSVKEIMENNYIYTGTPVEKDNKIITAIGAGHAVDFALAIAEAITDRETVEKVKKGMELI